MSGKLLLSLIIIMIAGFSFYKMTFSPVSVTFESRPGKILVNSSSPVVVDVFPLNRLGLKIPFVHLEGRFVLSEGSEKIYVVKEKEDELIFQTRSSTGRLVVFYYARNIPFPVEIILNIESAAIATNDQFEVSFTDCSNA